MSNSQLDSNVRLARTTCQDAKSAKEWLTSNYFGHKLGTNVKRPSTTPGIHPQPTGQTPQTALTTDSLEQGRPRDTVG